jgi:hypothetical protein
MRSTIHRRSTRDLLGHGLASACAALRERGRAEERARIVDWLRWLAPPSATGEHAALIRGLASGIEGGDQWVRYDEEVE